MNRFDVFVLLALVALPPPIAAAERWQHGVSTFDEFKYGADFGHFDYAEPDAPKGGALVLSTAVDYTNFTPFLPFGTPAVGMLAPGMLYDGLFVRANDEAYSVYGSLAKRVRFAADLSEVTVQLHDDAHWHDGVPITARDVKFTFDHVLAKAHPGIRAALSIIDAVEVRGELELLFRFKPIGGLNKNSFASPATYVAILPEHYWRTRDLSELSLEVPLGSGPYRVRDFEQGQFMLWERVATLGPRLAVHRAATNFDTIRYGSTATRPVPRSPAHRLDRLRVEADPTMAHRHDIPATARDGWSSARTTPRSSPAFKQP